MNWPNSAGGTALHGLKFWLGGQRHQVKRSGPRRLRPAPFPWGVPAPATGDRYFSNTLGAGRGRGTIGKAIVAGARDHETKQISAAVIPGTSRQEIRAFVTDRVSPGVLMPPYTPMSTRDMMA